ncbi:hypothetical protein Cni_G02330 [Canna indica]|uniref:VQ domain-containing protein n=1 Tax=Canna indica TaxID=4628 RepID=A0AAQ3PZP4_9LILI|nr:hypothetical protein Cni_G02330 [Canna indica]
MLEMRDMAENCSVLDPWIYRPEPGWISEASARENAALTRALQMSLSDTTTTSSSASAADTLSSPLLLPFSSASAADTLSSPFLPPDHLTLSSSRDAALGPSPAGRVSKRKSGTRKRSFTTFINTDPANFREMVQRMTGIGGAGRMAEPLLKPERMRPAVGAHAAALQQICLPTLDTSALFLGAGTLGITSQGVSFGSPSLMVEPPGFDLDSLLPAFPTLDSWGAL